MTSCCRLEFPVTDCFPCNLYQTAAVLHGLQTDGQTTTWQWTAPDGVTQLAEILVVAGEGDGASLPCTLCYAWTQQEPFRSNSSPRAYSIELHDYCTFQVVVVVLAIKVVEVVLAESYTRPTTQSHLARPTPSLLAKAVKALGRLLVMAIMGMTPPSLGLTQAQH
jgi:hypothetical protein